MRQWGQTSHIATLLVLQAAGAGLASPATFFTASVVESHATTGGQSATLTTRTNLSLGSVKPRSIVDWLPKDNQTTYILQDREVRRLELNSSHLTEATVIITVSPCTRNLLWSVYHGMKNRTDGGWSLVREYKGGETDTFSATLSNNDRYIVELRGERGGAAAAVAARAESGAGVRLRLRVRSKRRLSASWDHSPIDPQASTYCVVASRVRSYTSLCAARLERARGCRRRGCAEPAARAAPDGRDWTGLHNMAGEMFEGRDFKSYVRRKKYSRSTKMTDAEPVVVCVGSRTHHMIENLDFSKTYYVSLFGVGRGRGAGEALAAAVVRPRTPRVAAARVPLRDGARARAELRAGKAVFYYKAKQFSDGVWFAVVACGGAVDIEVSVKGKSLHFVKDVGSSTKFFVPGPRQTSSAQESDESYSMMESSSEESRLRYVVRVTSARRESRDASVVVEMSASVNRWDVSMPELQQPGGGQVRELRPMRSCRTLHIAFLPALYPADVIRYCVTARELDVTLPAAHGGAACGSLAGDAHARIHCADHTSLASPNVITQRVSGLRPGRKYAISVTATAKDGLPASYTTLYADSSQYCNGE